MSGPVAGVDTSAATEQRGEPAGVVERHDARTVELAGLTVRRLLPKRLRRTIGPWCFADHFGPRDAAAMAIGPHPHIGLQTVTWLLAGEVVHRDSLGSEQAIRPGQLNLMTAGRGVAHAEESPSTGPLHGVQLWIAQPDASRHGDPAFEHHADLPVVDAGGGMATVLLGAVGAARSPARTDSPTVGAFLDLPAGRPSTVLPLDPGHEHAVLPLAGALDVRGERFVPGELAYLPPGIDELALDAAGGSAAAALLLGGRPFGERVLMWWNFVARADHEIAEARAAWERGDDRFGAVASSLARIGAPPLR